MKRILFLLLTACALASCDNDDGIEVDEIRIPDGFALSAGSSTVFLSSSYAYDTDAEWVSGKYTTRFNNGDNLYDNPLGSAQSQGGLGPVYAGYSCGSCHRNAGRTEPTSWSNLGSGNFGFSSMLIYITRKNGSFFQDYSCFPDSYVSNKSEACQDAFFY
jgi:CxxC motif-containing protein (DUF1111 family)